MMHPLFDNPLLVIMLMCDLVQTVTEFTMAVGRAYFTLDLTFMISSIAEYVVNIE